MDSEKSGIEILTEFAEKTNREIESSEIPYPKEFKKPLPYYLKKVCIPNNKDNTSYFLSFFDGKGIGKNYLYSGVFILISVPLTQQISIRKRNILDIFKSSNILKVGNKSFDSKVIITGYKPDLELEKIFNNRSVQNLIIDALSLKGVFEIGVNIINVDYVSGLKDKSNLCIINRHQGWVLDSSIIENLFSIIEKIKEHI